MTAVMTLHRMKTFVRTIPVWVTQKWHWSMQKKLFWWNCLFAVSTAEVAYFWPAPVNKHHTSMPLILTVWLTVCSCFELVEHTVHAGFKA